MRNTLGGNVNVGKLLHLTCTASSAYAALLETATAKGTDLQASIGEEVSFSLSNAYEVGRTGNGAIPNGFVMAIERVDAATYYLTIAVIGVTPTGTTTKRFIPKAVVKLSYVSGTAPTLGYACMTNQASSTNYKTVQDALFTISEGVTTNDGLGCCIAVDTTNLTADYLV